LIDLDHQFRMFAEGCKFVEYPRKTEDIESIQDLVDETQKRSGSQTRMPSSRGARSNWSGQDHITRDGM
jgi:hypothetical protein